MTFRVDPQLLDRLDIERAIDTELVTRQGVPSPTLEVALEAHREEAIDFLKGAVVDGLELQGTDEIAAAKPEGGLRPLTVLSFAQRVLYQALASVLTDEIPGRARSFESFEEFQAAPLEEDEVDYVVIGDVASFYQYVDHELLRSELVGQTGDADSSQQLVEFLSGIMGRQFGLPQLYAASDALSEVVIDLVERRLLRRGLRVWRFNDDFRIAATDWRSAGEAIEILDKEVRAIGLTLNDRKTYPIGRENYSKRATATEAAWAEVSDEVDFDFRTIDPYSGTVEVVAIDATEEEYLVAAAARALAYWDSKPLEDKPGALPKSVYRRLLSQAISLLIRYSSPEGIRYCGKILSTEPQFTPVIARYLDAVGQRPENRRRVALLLSRILLEPQWYVSAWQSAWLLTPLLRISLPRKLIDWIRSRLAAGNPGILRALAAPVLSTEAEVPLQTAAALYSETPDASRPDLVAAVVLAGDSDDPLVRSIEDEGPVNRWIAEYARQAYLS